MEKIKSLRNKVLLQIAYFGRKFAIIFRLIHRINLKILSNFQLKIFNFRCEPYYATTLISFEDFKKLDIRIGKIISAKRVENSDKLLILQVDFDVEKRQIIAGVGKHYEPEILVGKECPFAFNLESRILKGLESRGMLLCADDKAPVLLHPDKEIAPGSAVK